MNGSVLRVLAILGAIGIGGGVVGFGIFGDTKSDQSR